jgi:hypothetical protein
VRYILKSLNLLNLLLAVLLFVFVRYALMPMKTVNIKFTLPVRQVVADPVQKETEDEKEAESKPLSDFIVISEQNLFHPERKIPIEKKADESKPLPLPEFVLFGTLVEGNVKMAFMDDNKAPVNTPGRGKRQRVLRIGENLSGFLLKEIHEDKVVMMRGEERIDVRLEDSRNKRSGVPETTTPAAPAGAPGQTAPFVQPRPGTPANPNVSGSQQPGQRPPLRRNFRSMRRAPDDE